MSVHKLLQCVPRKIYMLRTRIRVCGVVQGVGFRPFVWKRAIQYGLTGWVYNESSGVTIEIQGTTQQVEAFLVGFRDSIPPLGRINSLLLTNIETIAETEFAIRESSVTLSQSTPISPDIATCADCLRELNDATDRRYRYPFINCTNCGPRFTIVEDIPYDRPLTSMKSFPMCTACQKEYDDPTDRRFHAQPNACSSCGPCVWWVTKDASEEAFLARPKVNTDSQTAIREFRKAIYAGHIVAVKGIGGFHLACDASSATAIAKLRERKGRVEKPFAVMVRNADQAAKFAVVTPQERLLLESSARPVVLLTKAGKARFDLDAPDEAVAPGNSFIGIMLPYSPLHYLLIDQSPLVMTSGNLADEPIVRTNLEARQRLKNVADAFLLHDRDISVVCDDSVVRCVDDVVLPIRRSRGFAPLPVQLLAAGPDVLAVGGEMKSTLCVTTGNYATLSQHMGDMGNLETLEAMQCSVDHLLRLMRVQPEAIVADLHPGYLSGEWAKQLAKTLDVPFFRVQHHFAHVAGLHTEHSLTADQKIIGCCFDGTGFGTDGAIWGGEFMIADGSNFDRYAQLKYTPLPGGDLSVRRPYRLALAQLWASGLAWEDALPCVAACPKNERQLLHQQLEKNFNCISTSSMGRLFDAVASLIGIRHVVNYEAQAAMEMEALAAQLIVDDDSNAYSFSIEHMSLMEIGNTELLKRICTDLLTGVEPCIISARFHHAVANLIADVCIQAREENQINTVGLTGGVFQNVLLLRLAKQLLVKRDFEVLTHSIVPPNDGGLALGQAIIGRNRCLR